MTWLSGNLINFIMPSVNSLRLWPKNPCPSVSDSIVGEFSLEEMMAFVWRVKKWKINFQSEWSQGDDLPNVNIEYNLSAVTVSEFGQPLISESELVCKYPNFNFFQFDFITGGFFTFSFSSTNIVRQKNNSEFYSGISFLDFSPPNLWTVSTSQTLLNKQEVGQLVIQFAGYEIIAPIFANWQGGANPPSGIYINFNAQLIADEYWEYDPNDGGGPIYDSATGVQLRPLPN